METLTYFQQAIAMDSIGGAKLSVGLTSDKNHWVAILNGAWIINEHTQESCNGFDVTPQGAITTLWDKITKDGKNLKIRNDSRLICWNGFMWCDVESPVVA